MSSSVLEVAYTLRNVDQGDSMSKFAFAYGFRELLSRRTDEYSLVPTAVTREKDVSTRRCIPVSFCA